MASTKDVIYKQHTQHGVDPVHRYCMGVAGLGYSIDTGGVTRETQFIISKVQTVSHVFFFKEQTAELLFKL
jgi:hypothetical protein